MHPVILQALAGPIKNSAAAADTMQRAHQARRARRRGNWGQIQARPVGHRGPVLGTLCLAALILNLDTTIVNVALPALVRQLGATTTGLQWVVDAYNLVFAALVLAAGSTSDRLGRKGMLLAGLAVFGGASLAGAFAATTGELIAARAVMGLGAAMMFPATLSLLASVFTERRQRAAAIGLWGASAGVGVALFLPARPRAGRGGTGPAASARPHPTRGGHAQNPDGVRESLLSAVTGKDGHDRVQQ